MTTTMQNGGLFKKTILSFMAFFILSFGFTSIMGIETTHVAEATGTLKSQIKANDQKKLEETVDKAGSAFVKSAREIAIAVLVVLVVWMAYSLLIKKSAEGLADMKARMGVAIVAIAFIFFTNQILGFLFGILGVSL